VYRGEIGGKIFRDNIKKGSEPESPNPDNPNPKPEVMIPLCALVFSLR
jgi:hypothetical protein